MRICFLTHYFPPEGNAPASRTYEMAKRWVAQGHQVTVITCAPNVPDGKVYGGYQNRVHQVEDVDGIEVHRVWTHIAPNKGTIRRSINFFTYMFSAIICGLFVAKPDVLVASSPQFFCGYAGLILSKLRRLPFCLEIRDIWPESITAVGAAKQSLPVKILEKMELSMYAGCQRLITVGPGYFERLLERGVPREKMAIVSNGADLEQFKVGSDVAGLRKSFNLEGKFVCSYIGTIGMAHGLDVVIRAGKRLKELKRDDISLLIVGSGAERERLEGEVESHGLDNVIFAGRQLKDLMPVFLELSNVCLVHLARKPLFRTVLPSKLFEAAAMKRPVVFGVEGHSADLVREHNMGICITPEDDGELVDALLNLQSSPDLCHEMGESGRAIVQSEYNRDSTSLAYIKELSTTISSYHA